MQMRAAGQATRAYVADDLALFDAVAALGALGVLRNVCVQRGVFAGMLDNDRAAITPFCTAVDDSSIACRPDRGAARRGVVDALV